MKSLDREERFHEMLEKAVNFYASCGIDMYFPTLEYKDQDVFLNGRRLYACTKCFDIDFKQREQFQADYVMEFLRRVGIQPKSERSRIVMELFHTYQNANSAEKYLGDSDITVYRFHRMPEMKESAVVAHETWHAIENVLGLTDSVDLISEGTATYAQRIFTGNYFRYPNRYYNDIADEIENIVGISKDGLKRLADEKTRRKIRDLLWKLCISFEATRFEDALLSDLFHDHVSQLKILGIKK